MEKSRVSSQSLREHARRREKAKQTEPPISWTWRERIAAATLIMIILVGGVGPFTAMSIYGHRKAIERRIEHLKTKYELSDNQVHELQKLEREFRGTGNPISFRENPTAADKEAYRKRLNELLGGQNSDEITHSESN
jgi:hypothetical protein